MTDTPSTEINFEPIQIRFDGLDAEAHKIDLAQFGKAAVGISKIMATTAEFIATNNYNPKKRKLDYKVLIGSAQDNCITFEAVIQALHDIPVYKAIIIGVGINFFSDVYRLSFKLLWKLFTLSPEREKIEKELKEKLALHYDEKSVDKLIDTIHLMAEGLLPAAKNATQPINISCEIIQFGDMNKNYFIKLDADDKQAIIDREYEYSDLEDHRVLISELDWNKGTCHVSLQQDPHNRIKATITDPQVQNANNTYGAAANSKSFVSVTAKRKLFKGKLIELIISDIKSNS